jgi:hypothetical protein
MRPLSLSEEIQRRRLIAGRLQGPILHSGVALAKRARAVLFGHLTGLGDTSQTYEACAALCVS